jgi:sirohydrochlorin ferrochelatase
LIQTRTALLLIGHGSKMAEANQELLDLAKKIPLTKNLSMVQTAYLEIAQPDIPAGIAQCVKNGATRIVALPYFLSPGTHVRKHIPELIEAARKQHPQVSFAHTPPLGSSPRMVDLVLGVVEGSVETLHPTSYL